MGVPWLDVLLGIACVGAGVAYLRHSARHPVGRASGLAYAVMSLGMAAMIVPAADPVPRPVWVAVFAATGVWAAVRLVRRSAAGPALADDRHHLVGAAAMVFMLLGAAHGTGSHASGLVTAVVAMALAAWFLAEAARLLTHARPAGEGRGIPGACLAMNVGMATMLVVMA